LFQCSNGWLEFWLDHKIDPKNIDSSSMLRIKKTRSKFTYPMLCNKSDNMVSLLSCAHRAMLSPMFIKMFTNVYDKWLDNLFGRLKKYDII